MESMFQQQGLLTTIRLRHVSLALLCGLIFDWGPRRFIYRSCGVLVPFVHFFWLIMTLVLV